MKQGWKTCKFADIFDLQMGKTPSRDNPTYWGDDNMWVSIADMNEQKYMSVTKEGITDVAVQESGIKPIPQGTVIMSFKLSIGKVSIATSKLYTNEAIMGFIEKEEGTIVPEYLYYYLKGYKWKGANKAAMGMTLNKKTIADNFITYPSLVEQEKIVAELDCLSGIIEKKKQQLKELDALAQSIFYEMFGNPLDNEKGFPVYKIDDIITFQGGSQPDKKHFEYEASPDNIRLIQIRDYKSDKYITYIPKNLARRFCAADDIMIGRYGPPIFQILKGIEGSYNVALMKATPKQGDKEFIRAFLKQKCLLEYLESMSKRTAGQDGIQMDKLKSFPFPLPPIELQQEFACKIKSIEQQQELIEQSLRETETLFNSRMDYYFN